MKKVTMFQCEICNSVYKVEDEAINCENQAKEEPLGTIGDIVDYRIEMSGGFDDWFVELRISKIEDVGHYLIYHFEEFDEESQTWEESINCDSAWGRDDFLRLVTIK